MKSEIGGTRLNPSDSLPGSSAGILLFNPYSPARENRLLDGLKAFFERVDHVPLVALEKVEADLQTLLKANKTYNRIIFSSVNSFFFFREHLKTAGTEVSGFFNGLSVSTVGWKTSQYIETQGVKVHCTPEKPGARGLLEKMKGFVRNEDRILIPQSESGNPLLSVELSKLCAEAKRINVYRTRFASENREALKLALDKRPNVLVFTSPSSFHAFKSMHGKVSKDFLMAAIGEHTASAILEKGFPVDIQPASQDFEGLASAIADKLGAANPPCATPAQSKDNLSLKSAKP